MHVVFCLEQELLRFVLKHVEDRNVEALLEVVEKFGHHLARSSLFAFVLLY